MPLHQQVYSAMRGNHREGEEPLPHWDDLPEFLRQAMLLVSMQAAAAEREACAKVAETTPWSAPTAEGEWALREAGKVVAARIRLNSR